MNIDREARNRLAEEMRRFLAEESSAFQFDEAVTNIRQGTQDETVQNIAQAVWYFYDDIDDHFVAMTKDDWDYFQRLLLVLESNRHIRFQPRRCWSLTQLVAAFALVGFAGCIWQFGWGQHLLVFAIPLGFVSMGIALWRAKFERLDDRNSERLMPFSSLRELRATYGSVDGFQKSRYRSELKQAQIRSSLMHFALRLKTGAAWLLLSPIPLAFQTLPRRRTKMMVVEC